MTEISDDYEWPQPLKANLELLAKLQENEQVRQKVIEDIQKEVKKYLNDVDQFSGSTGYLPQTIDNSKELRSNILKTDGTYKHYETAFNDSDADKCVKKLIDNIFPLFGCLYYMYYECAQQCSDIKGGEWYDERCDGKGGSGNYLNEWLKDQKPSTEDSEDVTKHMIQRDFKQNELSNKKGEELFPNEEHEKDRSNRLLNYEYGAQLQSALYYMLFLPGKWNDAQSGHALLFLEAFCKMASENKLNGQQTAADGGTFKTACQKVQESIQKLLSSNTIVPVACSYTVKYETLLDSTHFWNYIDWLEKNLEQLITSLREMANDASNWTETNLMTSKSFGPYPWGFTFKDHNWEHKTKHFKSKLKEPLSQLTEALSGLKNALPSISEATSRSQSAAEQPSSSSASINSAEKPSPATEESSASTASTTSNHSTDSNDSTNSTASTIGGVAGGLGAAAATGAAAYAGSGFLGPVAEAVGKFFKGLFF